MNNIRVTKLAALILLFVFQAPFTNAQQIAAQPDVNVQIRREAMGNSQIMRTLHFLSDVYGPRLTGSPNHRAAADWTVKQMKEWSFDNVHLEPWDFGHPGWVNERASGFITAPVQDSLVFEVLAWTPSTGGTVAGQVFQLILPEKPTQSELTDYFNANKSSIKGKMILMGKPAVIPVNFSSPPKRRTDEEIRERLTPQATPSPAPASTPSVVSPRPGELTSRQINEQVEKFLLENGAAVRINDAARPHGQIRAYANPNFDVTKTVPTVVLRNEDFGRIARVLADGTPVSLEFNIRNQTFPEGKTSYNVIGEIPGTDKKDEVIMLGAHLDSWHAATGATDNAIGCAVMMEAVRILKSLGVKPRRTIRVALWSGEEEGLLGSQAYVKEHFGSAENPKPEFEKLGGYFNIDSGTGRARGMVVFGPPETANDLSELIKSFGDSGVVGAFSENSRELDGSDFASFNQAGLPGIAIAQDPIEYGAYTWHTNLDTYERIIEDDTKSSAAVLAQTVYGLAMRDKLLPRFSKETMPPIGHER